MKKKKRKGERQVMRKHRREPIFVQPKMHIEQSPNIVDHNGFYGNSRQHVFNVFQFWKLIGLHDKTCAMRYAYQGTVCLC